MASPAVGNGQCQREQTSGKPLVFASLREDLGVGSLEVELEGGKRVSDLIDRLVSEKGTEWSAILTSENIRVAVNQELISGDSVIDNDDEIAFFPPVTGG